MAEISKQEETCSCQTITSLYTYTLSLTILTLGGHSIKFLKIITYFVGLFILFIFLNSCLLSKENDQHGLQADLISPSVSLCWIHFYLVKRIFYSYRPMVFLFRHLNEWEENVKMSWQTGLEWWLYIYSENSREGEHWSLRPGSQQVFWTNMSHGYLMWFLQTGGQYGWLIDFF